MANAPFCNVEIARPQAKPLSPTGIKPIPPNTPLNQAFTIINNNFNQLVKGNFREDRSRRQTVITRIYDPSNPNVFVDVRQITAVAWLNNLTGQTITWDRGSQQAPAQPPPSGATL